MSENERITGVAMIDDEGRTWSLPAPHRHCHIFALAAFLNTSAEGDPDSQGFTTNKGRFLNRVDALNLVKKNGQPLRNNMLSYQLYSEDLW